MTPEYYIGRGYEIVPAEGKRPLIKGWPNRKFGPADFPPGTNIAIRVGTRSRDLVDCDLDCEEAIELAPLYLPETGAIFGRKSKPRSHWLYIADGGRFEVFADPVAGLTMLELRADGRDGGAHITIAPPSITDGERREPRLSGANSNDSSAEISPSSANTRSKPPSAGMDIRSM
jgi:hypothetical protein